MALEDHADAKLRRTQVSSNAIGAIAVICVSGFAGCAATARATPVEAPAPYVRAIETPTASSETVTPRNAARIYVSRADDFRRR